jgi:hypothetical protein
MTSSTYMPSARRARRIPRGIPVACTGRIVIQTGLSVLAAGCKIGVAADPATQTASVFVWEPDGYVPTAQGEAEIRVAAALLAERAGRFLGPGWKVVPWSGESTCGEEENGVRDDDPTNSGTVP